MSPLSDSASKELESCPTAGTEPSPPSNCSPSTVLAAAPFVDRYICFHSSRCPCSLSPPCNRDFVRFFFCTTLYHLNGMPGHKQTCLSTKRRRSFFFKEHNFIYSRGESENLNGGVCTAVVDGLFRKHNSPVKERDGDSERSRDARERRRAGHNSSMTSEN